MVLHIIFKDMTPQEIIDINKLLAEFLGSEIEETLKGEKVYCLLLPDENDLSGFKKEFFTPDELKFHKDWKWLMNVVEEIENLGMLFKVARWREDEVLTNGYWCTISDSFSGVEFADSAYIDDTETRIEAMFLACAQFIEWYNQNKGG